MTMVSVVIPMRNAAATISEQLDALTAQTVNSFEVIVADNGSTDGSADLARAHALGVRLIDASGRRGPSFARNQGAAAASGDVLLFCDADDVADSAWVETLSGALGEYPLAGGSLEMQRLNRATRGWGQDGKRYNPMGRKPLPWLGSGNFGIRRDVLEELGGWPEDILAAEDAALCWKAQLANHRLGYEPRALMHYRLAATLSAYVAKQYSYGRAIVEVQRTFPELGSPSFPAPWRVLAAMVVRQPPSPRVDAVGGWLGSTAYRLGRARAAQ